MPALRAALAARVHAVSGFDDLAADERFLVEKFLGRTTRYNDLVMDDVRRTGQRRIDVSTGPPLDELVDRILMSIRDGRSAS